ncbi:MAG: 4Fe-4S dicluster domain-containing protein [Candidatus Omnitrophota bacterium]|nr:4Fe-4S dicluster domain-containing protein [Candidatus Omnitrophota bacterium]
MIRHFHSFKGGYKFINFSGQPKNDLIELAIPEKVIIPLRQGFGTEVKPLVKKGDMVFAGQIIGRDDEGVSSPVHSSVNGIVEDVKKMNYFKREVTMVVIKSDRTRDYHKIEGYCANWEQLDNEKIEKLLYLSGVTSLDREGIPTRFKSSIISSSDVKSLIIHGVGSEPYNISLDVLLGQKKLLHFVEGIKILKKIIPNAKVRLALNSHRKRLLEEVNKLTSNLTWLDIYPLEPKYPQGYDEMLVPTILNRKFPFGYSAANIGIVVLNIQAVVSVYEAVAEGKPLIERIIAFCGPNMKDSIHARVRIGTTLGNIVLERLKEDLPSRVVLNSLLTGATLNDFDLPVDRTYSQIIAIPENKNREFLAFIRPGAKRYSYSRTFLSKLLPWLEKYCDTNMHGEERPCISCNYCEEVCPVQIIPHLISRYVRKNIIDETLMNYQIFHCIECGLCSFVCPSKIPLTSIMVEGQEKLVMQGCDRTQCVLPYFDLKGIEEYRGVREL